jgi:hypothetical protein
MFKIVANPTFDKEVVIPTPDGEQKITLTFRHMTRSAVKLYFDEVAKGGQADAAALIQIVAGWKDVDAEFSEATLASLLENYHAAVPAIFDAYLVGLTQAKTGN